MDYDIDKLYIMGYDILNNGTYQTWSKLQNKYDLDLVESLPEPNGVKYIENSTGIPVDLTKLDDISYRFERMRVILSSNTNLVMFLGTTNDGVKKMGKIKNEFLDDLNMHSQTQLSDNAKEAALRNSTVRGIINVTLDPQNLINLYVPINMEEQQEAASRSELGNDELHVTSDDPSVKYVMQIQNMVGKQVIGITAVSLKAFFAASTYFNNEILRLRDALRVDNHNAIQEILNNLMIVNPLGSEGEKITTIANLNFDIILDELKSRELKGISNIIPVNKNTFPLEFQQTIPDGTLDLNKLISYLKDISSRTDSALSLSGLLSSATDNAKELILSKINATSNFVDIYTYLMSIGTPFLNIAEFMQSPIFNKVVQYTNTNIFDPTTKNNKLDRALGFYLNLDSLPIVDKKDLSIFLQEVAALQGKKFDKKNQLDLLSWDSPNALDINAATKYAYKKWEESRQKVYNFDDQVEDEDAYADSMDFEEDFGANIVRTISKTGYKQLAKFLEEVKLRNEFMNSYIKKDPIKAANSINQLQSVYKNVLPSMQEQQILGAMLGVNQGLRTNDYDQYSFIHRVEDFVNRRYNDYIKENDTNNQSGLRKFDLMGFLNDPRVRKMQIAQYEKVKSSYNILDVISKVPHFAAMFNLLYTNDYCLNNYSFAYELERKIADDLVPLAYKAEFKTGKLKEKEFKEVQNYINDLTIVNWLKSKELVLQIPSGQNYFSGELERMNTVPDGQMVPVKLNTIYGIATFKYNMDNYIIPYLKSIPELKNNKFIQNLSKTAIGNEKKGTKTVFYRLPLNMMNIDASQKTLSLYESILNDFDRIAGNTFNGWKISDLFYLYNLITNKDAFGQNSMTRVFENLVHSKNQSLLVNDFNEYISKLDNDPNMRLDLSYNLEDIKMRIQDKFPDSKIKAGNSMHNLFNWNPSYFTFLMPNWSGEKQKYVTDRINKYEGFYKDENKLDVKSAVISLVNKLSTEDIPVHIIDVAESELLRQQNPSLTDKSIHAFIDNGEIYVLLDTAKPTDVIHEYTHLLLASMKYRKPNPNYDEKTNNKILERRELYYQLLNTIKQHPKFDQYAKFYPNAHGSDLQEEVLVRFVQNYLANICDAQDNIDLSMFNDDFASALESLLVKPNDEIGKRIFDGLGLDDVFDSKDDLISLGMSNFITVINDINHRMLADAGYRSDGFDSQLIKLSQKVSSIKDKLVNNKNLKQEC